MAQGPCIVARTEDAVSPWVRLVTLHAKLYPGAGPETYHALAQQDYLAILAKTPDGRIPVVRQFRPAVAEMTWELPAGLLESGEDPADAVRRELKEETGLEALQVIGAGVYFPDTGRLENRLHAFFVRAGEGSGVFRPEPGMEMQLLRPDELKSWIRQGKFRHFLHIGMLSLASLYDFDWSA